MNLLANQLIRPYRFMYSLVDLGKKKTADYERTDSYLLNARQQRLQYSYYRNTRESDVCAVYAHCNSGCRVEGTQGLTQEYNMSRPSSREGGMCYYSTSAGAVCRTVRRYRWDSMKRVISTA